MNSIKISSIREEYTLANLHESDLLENPFQQFNKWFQEALNSEIQDCNAMTLATVGKDLQPHARIVLLKGLEKNQFVFFTNYNSSKGQELDFNPKASLLFHWKELQRQVRIEGHINKISDKESTQYFHSRPFESQVGAVASHQSEILFQRQDLENRYEEIKSKYQESGKVPRPQHWGGYTLHANRIEFWQGRSSRLHDRLVFVKQNDNDWKIQRLNP